MGVVGVARQGAKGAEILSAAGGKLPQGTGIGEDKSGSNKPPWGWIVGGAVAAVATIAGTVGAVIYFDRRKAGRIGGG